MPVRPRRARRSGGFAWTADLAFACTVGPPPTRPDWPSDAVLREAWKRRGHDHQPHGDRAPWLWWRMAADVPDELRATRAALFDVDDAAERNRREDLERRRAEWLRERAKTTTETT